MGAAALPLMIAGTGMKMVGSIQGGYSKAAGLRSQANMADYNRQVSEQNARITSLETAGREDQVRREGRLKLGEQAAAIAESGMGFTGSNLDIMRQDAGLAELDARNVRYEGQLKRSGYESEGKNYGDQAASLRSSAKSAITGGWIGAGAAALSSAASYYGGGMAPKKGK